VTFAWRRLSVFALGHGEQVNDSAGQRGAVMATALSDKELALTDAYWRAANYLSIGQIYLYDNPLLTEHVVDAAMRQCKEAR
jgi:phosphoketolase